MLIFYYFDFCPLFELAVPFYSFFRKKMSFYICTGRFEFVISVTILSHFYRYTQVSTLVSCIATLIPHIFCITTQIHRILALIPHIRIPIPFLTFPPLFSTFPSFHSPISNFGFYKQLAHVLIFKNLFQENSCIVVTLSVLSPKINYLIVPQVKNL